MASVWFYGALLCSVGGTFAVIVYLDASITDILPGTVPSEHDPSFSEHFPDSLRHKVLQVPLVPLLPSPVISYFSHGPWFLVLNKGT